MVADHIVPMRAGGDDIPENIQFICPECDVTRKYTIRVPRGLADTVLHESHISFTEIVRIALVKYLEGQQDVIVANPPYSDNSELMRLRKQNSIMGQRIKMIEGALNWNPYSNYIDTDYIKDGM